jgi:hypothetical protein
LKQKYWGRECKGRGYEWEGDFILGGSGEENVELFMHEHHGNNEIHPGEFSEVV